MGRARKFVVVSALAAGMVVVPGAGAGHARSTPPGLRLVAALHHADVVRFPDNPGLFLPPAIYVAAVGRAFEIDASSAAGATTLKLVSRIGNSVRVIRTLQSPSPVVLGDGLPGFFHAVLRDSGGASVASSDAAFCPSAGFGLARLDASGPDRPHYPYFCGSPLTRATAWGLDKGWASAAAIPLEAPDAPDGEYTLTVSVNESWARQLRVQPADATATIGVTLTTETGSPCPPKIVCKASTARDGATHPTGEGASHPLAAERDGNNGRVGVGGLPDLAALPAHDFSVEHNPDDGRDYLDFGATIWNGGPGPLVLEGFRNGADTMTAVQFVYRNGSPVNSMTVGRMEFDRRPGHNHWHVEDIAQYDLLDGSGHRVVLSNKQSFCLAPTDPVDLLSRGADWQPDRIGLGSACGGDEAIWLREVLPAGWGDTYYQAVAGQSFDITDLPNGTYQVRITTNPRHNLNETRYDDNVSVASVTLSGDPGNRTVVGG